MLITLPKKQKRDYFIKLFEYDPFVISLLRDDSTWKIISEKINANYVGLVRIDNSELLKDILSWTNNSKYQPFQNKPNKNIPKKQTQKNFSFKYILSESSYTTVTYNQADYYVFDKLSPTERNNIPDEVLFFKTVCSFVNDCFSEGIDSYYERTVLKPFCKELSKTPIKSYETVTYKYINNYYKKTINNNNTITKKHCIYYNFRTKICCNKDALLYNQHCSFLDNSTKKNGFCGYMNNN